MLVFFPFLSLFIFVIEKDVKTLKRMILTSEGHPKHLFIGQNTQQAPNPQYLATQEQIIVCSLFTWCSLQVGLDKVLAISRGEEADVIGLEVSRRR